MAQKLSLTKPPVVKQSRKASPPKPNRLPAVAAMFVGAVAVLAFSLTQVARISPKRGDVSGIVREIRKEHLPGSSSLPNRVDPTRGTKLWAKKHANG